MKIEMSAMEYKRISEILAPFTASPKNFSHPELTMMMLQCDVDGAVRAYAADGITAGRTWVNMTVSDTGIYHIPFTKLPEEAVTVEISIDGKMVK